MVRTAAQYIERLESETRFRIQQAAMEGAALRGELGLSSQLLAMSEIYKALKSDGKIVEANAVKEAAQQIVDAAVEKEMTAAEV